jgi:hypothetical protein
MVERRETCLIVDLGGTVIMTLSRPVGRTRHHLQGPISRVLHALRDMEWEVVGTGCDSTGHLRVHLNRFAEVDLESRTASRTHKSA